MPLVPKLIGRLQRHPKRVVFPEGSDPRILQAARQWVTRRMGAPILLGERKVIKDAAARLSLDLKGMRIIEPARSEEFEPFVAQLEQIRSTKVLKLADSRAVLRDPNYFATMMLAAGQADALVGGATVTASSALRPLFQLIPRLENVQTASSLMILDWDEKKVGSDGSLFLADCGVIPEPTAEQLSDIAISTAMIARHLTDETPRVAMLSYASRSEAQHPSLVKVRTATELARRLVDHPAVSRVHHPSLQCTDPEQLVGRQMSGPGSMLALELVGGFDAARAMLARVRTMTYAVSLGSTDTLIQHPASLTHRVVSEESRTACGVSDALVRISVGLEDVEDLWNDVQQALAGCTTAPIELVDATTSVEAPRVAG